MRIVWDEPKRLANIAKHGIDFSMISETFFATALVRPGKDGGTSPSVKWTAY